MQMRKSNNPRSIAFQLILLFTLAAALLLACGLGIFYSIVIRHAFAEDNAVLADKLSAISTDLRENGPEVFAEELAAVRAGEHTPYWMRIIDPDGRTVAETLGMDRLIPIQIFPVAREPALALRNRKDYRSAAKLFSLVAFSENSNGHAYTLQVAQDRSSDEQVEKDFAFLFMVVLAGGVLASALIAIIVTRRGLRPLREMTQCLGRIGPNHLKEHIGSAAWPRELQPLTIAFDEMLKRLDDSFTRLSQFSADLAHELRTPTEYRETIESTVAECERLSRIVDNLLFVARVDAAREPITRKRFDARAAVEKIAAFYQAVADDHHVTISCSGHGQIYADPDLFERAVGNLLDNALRFTPEHGSIQIALSKHNTDFEVAVSDNGCGIAAEHLPRVFDRFYRAESSRGSDGAGLGLALVKSIVDLHGGSATIQSEVGRGTTVRLTFPLL
ncbi:MAG: two-component sensor histidine kinase [Verrucomicrobia bacterium]|nr:MAG: two-component sensor histidine kinase [Verrucomicrobiota bacterium]